MSHTIDASVFVSAARVSEVVHPASLEFLLVLADSTEDVFCPTLVLPECQAAIARRSNDPNLTQQTIARIEAFPRLHWLQLTRFRARRAGILAAEFRLRGADSVYVQVAEETGSALITWDSEMLDRASTVVPTITPSDWLASHSTAAKSIDPHS